MRSVISLLLITIVFAASAQVEKAKLANEYYQQGEKAKARALFEDLDKNKEAIPLIHSNYLDLLLSEQDYKVAEKFLNTSLKYYPNNFQYQISLLKLHDTSGDKSAKDKYFEELEKKYIENQYSLNLLAQNLVNQQMLPEAIYLYNKSRQLSNNPVAFALELAAVYRMTGDKEKMTAEYLKYAEANPRNLSYVKNLFQSLLDEEEDQQYLENTLIQKIQSNPNQTMYSELLIWLELQRKNFYAAFLQARALDKRKQKPGTECLHIARIALDNNAWEESVEILQYIVDQYPEGIHYPSARSMLIKARESKVKNQFPIDLNAIRGLAQEYQLLYDEIGPNHNTLDALRNKSLLHAFYLDEKDSAINILNKIINNRRAPRILISESKLDLGDIYLLDGQPWESTLLYSQVEKSDKESPIGYEAKLRNAKLNYYTGNFSLAKDHLDILKLATTREISNDAIALSLLIQNNTAFDSTDGIMQQFANIELLIFQNFHERAESELNQMLKNYPYHSLADEIYWQLSQLQLRRANYSEAVAYLDKIIEGYGYDILGDDAMFKKAQIVADFINDRETALNIFVEFLKTYPGSLYSAEARSRVRELRGDRIN